MWAKLERERVKTHLVKLRGLSFLLKSGPRTHTWKLDATLIWDLQKSDYPEHNIIFCNESLEEIARRRRERKIINRRALLFYWALSWKVCSAAFCKLSDRVKELPFSPTFITVCHCRGARSCQNCSPIPHTIKYFRIHRFSLFFDKSRPRKCHGQISSSVFHSWLDRSKWPLIPLPARTVADDVISGKQKAAFFWQRKGVRFILQQPRKVEN